MDIKEIVKALRNEWALFPDDNQFMKDAADLIEHQAEEIKQLRETSNKITNIENVTVFNNRH